MLARNLSVNFYVGGANWGEQIATYIKSVKYSDTIEEKADTVELVLSDNEHKFLKGGLPTKGTEMSIELVKHNWNSLVFSQSSPILKLPLGTFEIDEIEYRYPPSEIVLKFNSIPAKSELRGIQRNKSWEQTTLQQIASDIAGRAGLQLFYDAEEVEIKRAEQSKEADLPFLLKLCKNAGLNLKVADKKLIIFEALKYESKPPVIVMDYNDPPVYLKFDAKTTTSAIYNDAQVNYKSNNVTEWLWSLFGGNDFFTSTANVMGTSESGGAGVLNINQKVNNEAEAQRLARGKLREENKKEFQLSLTLMGSFSFLAGNVFELRGHGIFDGNYICDSTNHSMGEQGYTTQVTAHRCLKGY